jgi:hypothetical protein
MKWRANIIRLPLSLAVGALIGCISVPFVVWAFSPSHGPIEAWRRAGQVHKLFAAAFGVIVFCVVAIRMVRGARVSNELRNAKESLLEGDSEP